jgi:hypothetical protein
MEVRDLKIEVDLHVKEKEYPQQELHSDLAQLWVTGDRP